MRICASGATGRPAPIRQRIQPGPPALADVVRELRPAELFWIIKNGIKMTGMPESGSTHSDDEIWGIVAFNEPPEMSPEQYKLMKSGAGKNPGRHHHDD
jgi:hypothetical protein